MHLTMIETDGQVIRAGYDCPCGCQPSASYSRGGATAMDVCCCGNEFALGQDADKRLTPRDGFMLEATPVTTPWPEPVMAAWLVGSSVHPESAGHAHHEHEHEHEHEHDDDAPMPVMDPVCGMHVEPPIALEKGLHSNYKGIDYFFCGRGCKLEFDDDPEKYLDPRYLPSM